MTVKKVILPVLFLSSILAFLYLVDRGQSQSEVGEKKPKDSSVMMLPLVNSKAFPFFGRDKEVSSHIFSMQPSIIYFWASWCKKCKSDTDWLRPLAQEFSTKANVVVSASFDSRHRILNSGAELLNVVPVLHDLKGLWAKSFNVDVLPQTVVLNGQGEVVSHIKGPLSGETVETIRTHMQKSLQHSVLDDGDLQKRFSMQTNTQKVLQSVQPFLFESSLKIPLGLKQLKGRVWIANFLSTQCNSFCRRQANFMKEIYQNYLGEDRIRFVTFSLDPGVDDVEQSELFLEKLSVDKGRWFYLTGERAQLWDFYSRGLLLELPAQETFLTDRFLLVDHLGQLRGYYSGRSQADMNLLREDISILLGHLESK